MRALDALREQREAFLQALDASTSLTTFAHLLRALVDSRPHSVKVAEAVRVMAQGVPRHIGERERAGVVLAKIEHHLASLPLSGVPDIKTVRRHLEMKGETAPHFPHGCADTAYASTSPST